MLGTANQAPTIKLRHLLELSTEAAALVQKCAAGVVVADSAFDALVDDGFRTKASIYDAEIILNHACRLRRDRKGWGAGANRKNRRHRRVVVMRFLQTNGFALPQDPPSDSQPCP